MSSTYGGNYGSGPPAEGAPPEGSPYEQGGYEQGQGGYDPGAPGGIPPAGAGYPEGGGYSAGGDYQSAPVEGTYQGGTYEGGATAGAHGDTTYQPHGGATTYGSAGGATSTGEARPDVEDESVGTLVGKLTTDASKLIRQELDLAKAELREEAKKAGKAAGMLGGAGLAGLMVAVFAALTLVFLLDWVMFLWLAALIVTLLWAILGAVLFSIGRKKMAEVNPKPEQTIETLKEDKQWVQAQKN